MKRGSLYWINLEPSHPPEFGKVRPALIVSNSEHNLRLPTVVAIPISSQPQEIWPLRLAFELQKGKKSYLVLPGIRQVNKGRLQDFIGMVDQDTLARLNEAISIYLTES